ncbi:hypothetical protein PF049_04315 [Erythrobacteraceae bacterium WH01K]|nr:hypothetical protein PF049_04315 [Erythrobacteraceae bacterium WH01K]
MADPELRKLSYYFTSSKRKGRAGLPLMSVTMHNGLVPREDLERDKERKTKSSLEAEEHLLVEPGDIAYNMMRMWQGALGLAAEPANVSPAYGVMRPKPTVDPRFAAHWFKSEHGLYMLWAYSYGLTNDRLRLYPKDFLEIPVRWPVKPIQQRIAMVLDAWDAVIAITEHLVGAKARRLRWLRAEVLTGKTRLKGFNAPWQTLELAKLLLEHGESSTGTEEVHSVSVHRGLVNQIEHLGRSFAAASTDHYNRVLPGDIVYTKSPTGDFPLGIIKQSKLDHAAIVSPLYGVFTPASRELGNVLDALMASPSAAGRLLTPVVQKGAKNTIAVTNQNFLQAQLALPTDPNEIKALSKLVDAAQAELDVHMCELSHLRTQKRGLMQKLLTGEWRVPESIDALLPKAEERAA